MNHIKLTIEVADAYREALIAELAELDFEGFEDNDEALIAYIPQTRFNDVSRERIEQLLQSYPGNGRVLTEEMEADQNWNEQWEATVQGQRIGRFYVKPTWDTRSVPEDAILLEIDPKMAFGTGYHETTRLMLNLLPEAVREDDDVLDAGTGTGVLAIAAVKLGVQRVFAFDIDPWSFQNASENLLLNDVAKSIELASGSVETIPSGRKYDAVLANINRNVIEELLPEFCDRLKAGGRLLLSGLLQTDVADIKSHEALQDFKLKDSKYEGEWAALLYEK